MNDEMAAILLVLAFVIACIVWPQPGQAAGLLQVLPSHNCTTDTECEDICLTDQECDHINQLFLTNQEK